MAKACADNDDRKRRLRQIVRDYARCIHAGETVQVDVIVAANPDLMPELGDQLRRLECIERAQFEAAAGSTAISPERRQRINDLFLEAAPLAPKDRSLLLDKECGDDSELRAGIESLLANDATETTPFDPPSEIKDPNIGRRIGPYEIKKRIGSGGMGSVYLAVRIDDFKQSVAIKLIKRGMDTDEILRRFNNERQVLAALKHPNIARLLDGGTTDDGLPYFVMEYIEGQPVDEYCDKRKLNTHERLKLFQAICAAVQFAHQNTVIHRDLKPANILIQEPPVGAGGGTGVSPVPKLVDFGIAKLTNREIGFQTLDYTKTEYRFMTPEYASPEQVRGDVITTASDVYSLGVVLYELLTGHRPYRLATRAKAEIERVVCEEEPPRPSEAITRTVSLPRSDGGTRTITPETVSKTREGTTDRLRKRLAGDIDNIVLLAMRKEPQRRYPSVEQLSADLQRHLNHEPVFARPPNARYRLAKFVRRNRGFVAAVTAVFVVLVAGVVASTWFAVEAERQTRIAKAQATFAQTMKDFLHDDLLVAAELEEQGRDVTVREVLDAAPPVVIKTVPASGDTQVDAASTKEIRVTFNKKMADKSWAWVMISRDTYPSITGPVRFDKDRQTCIAPVELQPARTYVIWFNSARYKAFRGLDGQPAVPYLLVFETK